MAASSPPKNPVQRRRPAPRSTKAADDTKESAEKAAEKTGDKAEETGDRIKRETKDED